MRDFLKKYWGSPAGLIFVLGLLLGGTALISWMKPFRIDLTEHGIYTLSSGTQALLKKLDGEPVRLTFYYSDKVTENNPGLRTYAKRVREMLEEYELQSDGKILLDVVDPEPFSEAEDRAAALGLQGIPAGNNDTIYFGLVGEQAKSAKMEKGSVAEAKREIIAFFNPDKERSLEYEISQLIYRLQRKNPLVVGVISDIPIFQHRDARSGQVERPKIILEQLRQMFDVQRVYDNNIEHIDDNIDLLMVIHPNLWPESTLYAIDQFVLRGGRLVVFMDPKAEMDRSESMIFGDSGNENKSSSLEQLLPAWGVQYDPHLVLLDYGFAHTIPVTQYGQALPHVGVIGIRDAGFNRNEAMSAVADQVNLASSGVISPLPNASTTFTPLMQSSGDSQLITVEEYDRAGNHEELLKKFQSDKKGPKTIAAYINGEVKSAFPDGKPVSKDGNSKAKRDSATQADPGYLSKSVKPVSIVLFADTDILDDRMWVQVEEFYGQLTAQPWASNSDLILNVLEKLGGSEDLINVRSRGTYHRPFEKVREIELAASERLREEQAILQKKLSDTEDRLMALSGDAAAVTGADVPELNAGQKAELEKFQQERLQIRKRLREVQHQLNRDIERLGGLLKWANMLAVPLLIALSSLFYWILRRRRTRSEAGLPSLP